MVEKLKKLFALGSILILGLAWLGGQSRSHQALESRIGEMIPGLESLEKVETGIYRGQTRDGLECTIALATRPSYGGPLTVALVVGPDSRVVQAGILGSTDTRSFLQRVVDHGILDAHVGAALDGLPRVDGVSGATLSSDAVIQGLAQAVESILGRPSVESSLFSPSKSEWVKLGGTLVLFAWALVLVRLKPGPGRRWGRRLLSLASLVTLGFLWGSPFSLSSLGLILSGMWQRGLASWAAVLCMALAVVLFLVTRKNLYCAHICPFGTLQAGLGKITRCPAPGSKSWMAWVARGTTLAALAAALYYRDPSLASYEPFAMAFSFIGSPWMYGLTLGILLASLLVHRPWCKLFCPVNAIFDYLRFMRRWLKIFLGKRRNHG